MTAISALEMAMHTLNVTAADSVGKYRDADPLEAWRTVDAELEKLRQRCESAERRLTFLIEEHAVLSTDGEGRWRVTLDWMPNGGPYPSVKGDKINALDTAIDRAGGGERENEDG